MKRETHYKSEADMCADFIAWAQPQGWIAYNEVAGWDILLVRADGEQFGVSAKLRFNATLLRQVLPNRHATKGPDRRAVLLPRQDREITDVCDAIGVGHFYAADQMTSWNADHPKPRGFYPLIEHCASKFDWNPSERCKLPEFVPDVPAGASAPVQLTEWKIAALRICAILETNGFVTREDFKVGGIDHRRWTAAGSRWLRTDEIKGRYVRGDELNFDKQHPLVYVKILAEQKRKAMVP